MSVTRSISLYTDWSNLKFDEIIDFYQKQCCNVNFDGYLNLMGLVNGSSEYFEVNLQQESPFFLLKKLYLQGRIFAFSMNIELGGIGENITVFKYEDRLCFTLNGASKKIDGYYSDYTWYLRRLIKPLLDCFNVFDRIVYEDIVT